MPDPTVDLGRTIKCFPLTPALCVPLPKMRQLILLRADLNLHLEPFIGLSLGYIDWHMPMVPHCKELVCLKRKQNREVYFKTALLNTAWR